MPKQLKYHIIYLPIEHDEFKKDPNIIKVVINNWEIPREMLILNRISSLEIAYNEE